MPFAARETPRTRPFADPMVFALFAFAVLLTWGQVLMRISPSVATEAGHEARLFELRWVLGSSMAPDLLGKPHVNPWDNAIETVICSESDHLHEARGRLEQTPRGAFRACWWAAYEHGSMPAEAEARETMRGLGGGLAARLLDARLKARARGDGSDIGGLRARAIAHYRSKALVVFSAYLLVFACAVSGVFIGARMYLRRVDTLAGIGDPPTFGMSGVMAVRIFLAWYIVFLSSATLEGWIGAFVPLGHLTMPLAYMLHVVCGIGLVCRVEGVSLSALWGRMVPEGGAWLRNGAKYLLLALGCALLLNMALSPLMPEGDPPQREVTDFIRGVDGLFSFATVFGTVALLGPMFEEVFFRGFLLPVMRRRMPLVWALLASGALFAAVHLQAAAFPLLALLGSVLGLAFLLTRDIRVAIFVHACWNGGAFLLQKLLH